MAKDNAARKTEVPDTVQTQLPETPKNFRERFQKVETERTMFNPNKGCTGALVGYLINLIPMAPIQRGKEMQEWECFVIKTTEACMSMGRDGQVMSVPPGSEVLTPATHQLTQAFARVASHPKVCAEIMIEPKTKIPIGHGQSMWTYDLGVNTDRTSLRLRSSFGANAMLGSPDLPVNQLPGKGQSGAETAGEVSDDDIPF
jgi:hypothetical protein